MNKSNSIISPSANNRKETNTRSMRKFSKITLPALTALIIASCVPAEPTGDVEKLKADKARFQDSIAQIDLQLEALDTVTRKIYPKVTFHETAPIKFEHYFSAQGYVESEKNVLLTPEVGGLIREIHVQEGQMVSDGQKIATFDAKIISSNIQEINEQIELAEYNYNKQKTLYEKGVGTEFNLKQAEGQLETLRKTKATLQTQAGKTVLYAPFAGKIEDIIPSVGEMAAPGMPVARLVNLDDVYVTADVSEIYLGKLNKDNLASVSFSALPGKEYVVDSARVGMIGSFVNPANRTIKIRVNLPENDKYVPNLVATIRIRDYVNNQAIVVPSGTITQDSKGNDIVFVGEKGRDAYKVKSVIAKTGMTYQGMTEILEGLDAGSLVVDQGSQAVYDGLEVQEL